MSNATEELERGQLAADVLNNRVYREAMEQIQQEIIAKWQKERDEAARDWLWTLMQAAKRLDMVLQDTMQTGVLRQKQIERETSRLEKFGQFFTRA